MNYEEVLANSPEILIESSDQFLKVRETLTRIGIANRKTKELFQSCHVLHKRGRYWITHFKTLYALDGRPSTLTEEDRQRTHTIACLLEKWGLCNIVNKKIIDKVLDRSAIFVLPYREKDDWSLLAKYKMGAKRHNHDDISNSEFHT